MEYKRSVGNSMEQKELIDFGQYLALEIGFPVLARGYSQLVQSLRQDEQLLQMVRLSGVEAALSGDNAALAQLRKGNKELVTVAEKEAELLMTAHVKAHYPNHAIVGEEHGFQPGTETRWVFDPVDGTSAMIHMAITEAFDLPLPSPIPSFGITVGLVEKEEAVLGVVVELQPHQGTLVAGNIWVGAKGHITRCNNQPVHLPLAPDRLEEAILGCTVPHVMFHTPEKWGGYQALESSVKGCISGQNCIGFMRLLQKKNAIDIVYEADLAYHDAAALIPILQGAGVRVSDGEGGDLHFPEEAIKREFTVLAGQTALHQQAVKTIAEGISVEDNSFTQARNIQQGYAQKFPGRE